MANEIDINENDLLLQYPEVLQTLLRDHSRFDHLREKLRRAGKDPKEAEGREDECHIMSSPMMRWYLYIKHFNYKN